MRGEQREYQAQNPKAGWRRRVPTVSQTYGERFWQSPHSTDKDRKSLGSTKGLSLKNARTRVWAVSGRKHVEDCKKQLTWLPDLGRRPRSLWNEQVLFPHMCMYDSHICGELQTGYRDVEVSRN